MLPKQLQPAPEQGGAHPLFKLLCYLHHSSLAEQTATKHQKKKRRKKIPLTVRENSFFSYLSPCKANVAFQRGAARGWRGYLGDVSGWWSNCWGLRLKSAHQQSRASSKSDAGAAERLVQVKQTGLKLPIQMHILLELPAWRILLELQKLHTWHGNWKKGIYELTILMKYNSGKEAFPLSLKRNPQRNKQKESLMVERRESERQIKK